jgi:two-component system, NarL family, nitrate/nitrite response regulator NarL
MSERIALIDDHGLIAHTLTAALGSRGHEVVRIDPAADDLVGEVLVEQAALVLLDLDLGPRGDATPLIPPLRDAGVPVVMVTGIDDRLRHAACVRAGAVGVVRKSTSFAQLTVAVERALAGERVLAPDEHDDLLAELRAHETAEHQRLAPFERLSPREEEVLGLLLQGRSVAEVARSSFVSIATVRSQVRSILTKLDASSQVVAVARAREAGWVPPQER